MAGVVFNNEHSVQAWLTALNEPEVNRFVPDFMALFLLAEPKFESVEQGVDRYAAAAKARFSSLDLATIDLSYKLVYPNCILKTSEKEHAMADTDGVEWAAGFLSHDAFEGRCRYGYDGTHQHLKKSIKNVRAAMEGGIDVTFPAQLHPKANAVFKMQLKLTVEQCLGFLDALSPLFKRVSRSGLSAKENWLRVLAFAKHVFDDVANVRTINSEATMGPMVWASFRTSELLKSYQTHKWVGHPQTSSILAFTSIQKKGKAQKEMQSALDTLKSTTSCLEREVNKVKEDQKEMICKNTSLA
jgi:cell division protein FtsB